MSFSTDPWRTRLIRLPEDCEDADEDEAPPTPPAEEPATEGEPLL